MSFIQPLTASALTGPIQWTVPSNQCWQVLSGHIILTTSATGGNRWLYMRINNDASVLEWDAHAGVKQSSSVEREYSIRYGGNRETSFVDTDNYFLLPRFSLLNPGDTLTIEDHDAIDTANDTFTARIKVMRTTGSNIPVEKIL